jgi:DNA-directed RNA polymerase subunit H
MVDVSDHELVPEHRVLDEDDLEDVLQEYNIKKTDLPKIKYDMEKVRKLKERSKDPLSKVRGYEDVDTALFMLDYETDVDVSPGDVVEVVRDSRTTDQAVVYRLVVE